MKKYKLKYFKIRKRLYCYIYLGNGKYQLYHRYIMEIFLNRKLNSCENIHHKNGDSLDNRISNLEILNKRDHGLKHHFKGNPVQPKKKVDKNMLIDFINKGLNGYDIARELNIGKSSIYRRFKEYGI